MKDFYTYILASRRNGTLYVGVTSDIVSCIYQHKNGLAEGFTKKHSIKMLVYYEHHYDAYNAIRREKILKKWRRISKLKLIEEFNPKWCDLYNEII